MGFERADRGPARAPGRTLAAATTQRESRDADAMAVSPTAPPPLLASLPSATVLA